MLKALYRKHQYLFNMLAVLLLIIIIRTLDSLSWLPPSPNKLKMVILNYLFEFIAFVPIVYLLIYTYRWTIKRKQIALLYFVIIIFALVLPTLVLILSSWLQLMFSGFKVQPVTFDLIERYTPGVSLVILLLSGTNYLTHLLLQNSRQKETAHQTETLAREVQLKMLRYQINPHFLFNVLNSIYTLIDENTEKAKKLVIDMSEYYRYTLNKQQMTVSIEKEVESVLKYLEIQKTRFEEEFEFEISVDETAKPVNIPSFIIHLLIENAVKYGTRTMKQKLIIRLSAVLANKKLRISVANTGKLVSATSLSESNSKGTSNGIENLKNRLSLYYSDNYSFSLREEGGWVIAAIEIENIEAI